MALAAPPEPQDREVHFVVAYSTADATFRIEDYLTGSAFPSGNIFREATQNWEDLESDNNFDISNMVRDTLEKLLRAFNLYPDTRAL